MDKTTQIVFIVFTAVVLVSVLIQLGVILGMFFAARKAQKKVHALVDDLRIHVLPIISSSRGVLEDLSPKVKVISSNLVAGSGNLRTMAEDVAGVVGDVSIRMRAQAAHVDGMVEGTLDHITRANDAIQHGMSVPLRHLNGILNGLRAGINVMCEKTPRTHRESESDLFV